MRANCFYFDTNNSGVINVTKLHKGLSNADIQARLENVPACPSVLILYVCAIFFTQMIGRNIGQYINFPDAYVGAEFNPEQCFGEIWRTMLTLFNIVLMSGG